ncbi:hypothetical protein LCGC14_1279860 [marine sediment metagenome]|uniref:Uncharacterized protein n=1 Tax=marine sediment metagenome TaxID=412755 RepID=A0A0F9NYP5_9ZZZZ
MKAYKWTTDKMQAFHNGHQFNFGWNEEDGVKDGSVCKDGGFHITRNPDKMCSAQDAQFPPNGKMMCRCYEVYYLKKDILGDDGFKLRVKAFKILKKKVLRESPSRLQPRTYGTPYVNFSYTTDTTSGTGSTCWGTFSLTATT